MEYAHNNGYVYRTNIKMMEETGIKSEHTLIMAIRTLVILKFIETKRGKRKEAGTYKLLKNCSNNCSNNCKKCSTESDTDIDTDKENNNNLSILELKDLGPKVTEDKKENKKKKK